MADNVAVIIFALIWSTLVDWALKANYLLTD